MHLECVGPLCDRAVFRAAPAFDSEAGCRSSAGELPGAMLRTRAGECLPDGRDRLGFIKYSAGD